MSAYDHLRESLGLLSEAKDVLNFPEMTKIVVGSKSRRKMRGLRMIEVEGMPAVMGPKKAVDLFVQATKDAGFHPKVYTDKKTRRPIVVVKASAW